LAGLSFFSFVLFLSQLVAGKTKENQRSPIRNGNYMQQACDTKDVVHGQLRTEKFNEGLIRDKEHIMFL